MTQDSSRLDRIEAAIEAMQQRADQDFDRQMQLNAEFRTRQEIQNQNIDNLITVSENLIEAVQIMTNEFRQHRSDGHGA